MTDITAGPRKPKRDYTFGVDFVRLGQQLREERERQGRSRAWVSKRGPVTESSLQEIEKGEGNPEIGTLIRIAAALGVKLAPLVAVAEGMPETSNKAPEPQDEKSGSAGEKQQVGDTLTYPVPSPFDTLSKFPTQRERGITAHEPTGAGASYRVSLPRFTVAEADFLERIGSLLQGIGLIVVVPAEDEQAAEFEPRRRKTDRQNHG